MSTSETGNTPIARRTRQQQQAEGEEQPETEQQQQMDAAIIQQIAQAVGVAVANAMQPAAPNAAFALTPAQASQGAHYDFSGKLGQITYKEATKSLYSDKDDLFDAEEGQLTVLLSNLSYRAQEMGWVDFDNGANGLMNIPDKIEGAPLAQQGPYRIIYEKFGELSMEQVKTYELFIAQTNDKRKQQLQMLFKCLMASLSVTAMAKVDIWKEQFNHVVNENGSNKIINGGLSLIKVIIRETGLETNASISTLREELSRLDEYALTVKGDVEQINAKAKQIVDGLSARGATTTELTTNLYKAYKVIPCKAFTTYIQNRQDDSNDADTPMLDNKLMGLAVSKYKLMKQQGEFKLDEDNESKLLALTAEVKSLRKQFSKKPNDKGKNQAPTKKPRPEWLQKHIRPVDDELFKPKKWKDMTYWWCHPETKGKCDGKWRTHHPSSGENKCQGLQHLAKKHGTTPSTKPKAKKAQFTNAYEAVRQAEGEGTDE